MSECEIFLSISTSPLLAHYYNMTPPLHLLVYFCALNRLGELLFSCGPPNSFFFLLNADISLLIQSPVISFLCLISHVGPEALSN